jgi:DNA-binding CsgD family transcriptional regulator
MRVKGGGMSGSEFRDARAEAGDVQGDLERGRERFRARAWASAHEALMRAEGASPLAGEDLERLAVSAYLIGRDADYQRLLERAHQAYLVSGARARAVRAAFWLGLRLLLRGEVGTANGWLGRAERLLERQQNDCAERGYLALLVAQQKVRGGDWDAVIASAAEAVAAGERFAEPDLLAAALHLQGRARLQQGQVEEGLSLLDEAMVGVVAGELSPLMTGLVYCSVIEGCREVYALDRAREWTAALYRWCEAQPEMMAFVGLCQVHRAELLQLEGAWSNALREARRAFARSVDINRQAAAAAFYQQAEVHRLRGEFAAAEAAYRDASQWGWAPQPGLALLRLAQGHTVAATAAIRRALAESAARPQRMELLAAAVEIMLAARNTVEAREACRELQQIADSFEARWLRAMAAQAAGAVELAEGNASAAVGLLRRAWQAWQELDVPYLAARARVLLGRCCRELGDHDGAELELAAARTVFEKLGAAPDLTRLDAVVRNESATGSHGLTSRELEVLRLVAAGKRNRDIAGTLFLSERTIERHVSNILRKLDVPSRSAAIAHAFRYELVRLAVGVGPPSRHGAGGKHPRRAR